MRLPLLLTSIAAATACSGGGGGGSPPLTEGFHLVKTSVPDGAVWQINRQMVFEFTEPVDFSTVSLNTIRIQSDSNVPATGTFSFLGVDTDGDGSPDVFDETKIVFQPNCPTRADLSDTGLKPGGVNYELEIFGKDEASNTILSQDGRKLESTQRRRFSTPLSSSPSVIFLDTVQGPPTAVVRSQGSTNTDATYIELAGKTNNRVYFEFDPTTQVIETNPPGFESPLNLYSDEESRIAVIVAFNQPVSPTAANLSPNRVRIEYQDSAGAWHPIDTRVEIVRNCTQTGAAVRLTPIGVLPPDSTIRVAVQQGFQDLTGEGANLESTDFAIAPTVRLDFTSLTPGDVGSDELIEQFDFGAPALLSQEDGSAVFETPPADWGEGRLSAGFDFQGTGGPEGTFDWVVRNGDIFFFDTNSATIVGGPGGLPTAIVQVPNGVVDLRNLTVAAGGEIRVLGPNPMVINATGEVRINGLIDVSGFNAKNVVTLNTGNQAEVGGAGAAGGGTGGGASQNLNGSTPFGGTGEGPFNEPNAGGKGGEAGYGPGNHPMSPDNRRPAGGGGGRFAEGICDPNDPEDPDCTTDGRIAWKGVDGHPDGTGAENPGGPARGGAPGRGPFTNGIPEDDFFGLKAEADLSGGVASLVRGELQSIWAGYGGGGGGDAVPGMVFPHPNWSPATDEKGGGGGGGAGGLNIRAIGRIVFGPSGEIRNIGGRGGFGESTNFVDHVGGTGGSGSGGHIVLESASQVDFSDGGKTVTMPRNFIVSTGGPQVVGPLFSNGVVIPSGMSHGGAGGPGVVQIHVPDPLRPPGEDPLNDDIVLPAGLSLEDVSTPTPIQLVPRFGARSQSRSKWITIGGADQDPSGGEDLVSFLFEGVDDQGKIQTTNGRVNELDPLVGPILVAAPDVVIEPDGVTLTLSGGAISPLISGGAGAVPNDIYLRTPKLLRGFEVRLREMGGLSRKDFTIADATYADAAEILTVVVAPGLEDLNDFVNSIGGPVELSLIPRFFRVVTNNVEDALPDTACVRIRFQAARADSLGLPDESNLLVDWTGDIADFNLLPQGALQFFRFEVVFDLDATGMGISGNTEPVTIDFLKIPFQF